ncbi:MAG TPA: crossover junction endodeoxyribonuclease RuvC [Rickettsiales bacterium]|nr:crossover junction endodeoxyribonuclease RuvC [Rickettsiales bacterium]
MGIIIGIDPGLQKTGWGIIRSSGNSLSLIACGTVKTDSSQKVIAPRLLHLSSELSTIIAQYNPDEAAVEETFVNVNGQSTLKLGQARGAILLTLVQSGLPVSEYAATLVKKSVVGIGRAEKHQVAQMVQMLLPGCGSHGADAMDALAVAICHAHHHRFQ